MRIGNDGQLPAQGRYIQEEFLVARKISQRNSQLLGAFLLCGLLALCVGSMIIVIS